MPVYTEKCPARLILGVSIGRIASRSGARPRAKGGTVSRPELHVVLAKPRGFCAGVVRAIEIVERALARDAAPVYVRHAIVHNRHVVNRLRDQGAVFVEEVDAIPDGATTIFSAHGVSRVVEQAAHDRGLPVIDATCPLVAKVHAQARRHARSGRAIVLIGHAGHAEVEGTIGQIDAPVHVVGSIAEVAALPIAVDAPVAYITQTTLSVDEARHIIDALTARFHDLAGPALSGICYATQNRQAAARALARTCDVLIVVGASTSSNSNRLYEIGVQMGVPSYLVDDGEGLDPAWIDGAAKVGLTAGASAPQACVDSVIATLGQWRDVTVSELEGVDETMTFALPAELRAPQVPA